jgi:hypothetical protein
MAIDLYDDGPSMAKSGQMSSIVANPGVVLRIQQVQCQARQVQQHVLKSERMHVILAPLLSYSYCVKPVLPLQRVAS